MKAEETATPLFKGCSHSETKRNIDKKENGADFSLRPVYLIRLTRFFRATYFPPTYISRTILHGTK